jgi:phage/plasmid primase-like uncharacterized protein
MFKKDGRRKGCFFRIGPESNIDPGNVVYITEGYSTGVSVFVATGRTTFVSFTSGNLNSVYTVLREKYPKVKVIIAGDNDIPGHAHDLPAIYPEKEGQDWNDVYLQEGPKAVAERLFTDVFIQRNPFIDRVSNQLKTQRR